MLCEWIRTLYAYNTWANQRLLDTCAQLSDEQFTASVGLGAVPSIRDILVHLLSGQEIWLSRCQGDSPRPLLAPHAFATLAQVRQYWDELDARTHRYLDGLREEDLAQPVHYITTKGIAYATPLWQILIHQLNHATQHRSEVALLLTGYGFSPGDLDLILYLRQMNHL